MFSGLASLLFGSSTQDTSSNTEGRIEPTDTQPSISDNINLRLLSAETEEDDWLLVDKEEEESLPRTDSEEELPFVEIVKGPTVQRPCTARHQRVNGGGAINSALQDGISQSLYVVSSSPANNLPFSSMEESWFLTPPPCFTSTGPVNMETSPFENLLIEHPSMSVYRSIRSAQEAAESFVNLDLGMQSRRSQLLETDRSPAHTVRVASRPVHRVENLAGQQAKQGMLLRHSQKVHDKKERQSLCRSALKRGNKVRDYNSKGNRHRRSDMQHCKVISGANNNRKC